MSSCFIEDGELRAPLTLRCTHSGVVGPAGFDLVIEPSGSWRLWGLIRGARQKLEKSGQLSREQIQAVADELTKFDFINLPSKPSSHFSVREREVRFADLTKRSTGKGVANSKVGRLASAILRIAGLSSETRRFTGKV